MKILWLIPLLLIGCRKPVLYNGLQEGEWINRSQAGELTSRIAGVEALGHFGDDRATATLKHLLDDPNVGIRYYAAEALWRNSHDADAAIPALRGVIADPLGWSYRDRMIPLFKEMGVQAKPLVPDIRAAIDNAPNSKQTKWYECMAAIPK